jgi:hypothetical protein
MLDPIRNADVIGPSIKSASREAAPVCWLPAENFRRSSRIVVVGVWSLAVALEAFLGGGSAGG